MSGESGLLKDGSGFALDIGAAWEGASPFEIDYVLPRPGLRAEPIESPFVHYQRSQRIKATAGSSLGEIYDPWFNRTFAHFSGHQHAPRKSEPSGYDSGVLHGPIAYLAHPVFTAYRTMGHFTCRRYVAQAIRLLLGEDDQVRTNLPSNGRLTLTRQAEGKAMDRPPAFRDDDQSRRPDQARCRHGPKRGAFRGSNRGSFSVARYFRFASPRGADSTRHAGAAGDQAALRAKEWTGGIRRPGIHRAPDDRAGRRLDVRSGFALGGSWLRSGHRRADGDDFAEILMSDNGAIVVRIDRLLLQAPEQVANITDTAPGKPDRSHARHEDREFRNRRRASILTRWRATTARSNSRWSQLRKSMNHIMPQASNPPPIQRSPLVQVSS